jgi:hypothetical protein
MRRRRMVAAMGGDFRPRDIPQSEADALIAFYKATGGGAWTDNSGWLSDRTVNNWFGVTVVAGHVTALALNGNNLAGEGLSSLAPLTSMTDLYLYANVSLTGDIADIAVLASLVALYLYSTGVAGDIADIAALTLMEYLQIQNTGVSGSIADIAALTSLIYLHAYDSSVSGGNINAQVAMWNCRVDELGWNAATVDAWLLGMYTNRASYTHATPALNIGGTNAAPSGVYQYAAVPSTGNEYRYKLANDDDADGDYNLWIITV